MCFFCGGAGPETVMEVESEVGVDFTAEQIIMKGTLKLNDSDINMLMYRLENATLVK
jgi:translation initiation factor IF-2